ncbi:unnamed protein product [Pleuronectes platessa]|uniref:Uncharacterized protein n=1 Tax=Pleuronectes platessa TaxID=8262 RepID=A0A9N7Z9H4_PLEPL|nr:unnamed protein product [Pleuronectes platessa]
MSALIYVTVEPPAVLPFVALMIHFQQRAHTPRKTSQNAADGRATTSGHATRRTRGHHRGAVGHKFAPQLTRLANPEAARTEQDEVQQQLFQISLILQTVERRLPCAPPSSPTLFFKMRKLAIKKRGCFPPNARRQCAGLRLGLAVPEPSTFRTFTRDIANNRFYRQ